MIIETTLSTEDNEVASEARSQWSSFAIEGAVRRQLQEEGVKREEVGDLVRDLLRDERFLDVFSKVRVSYALGGLDRIWFGERREVHATILPAFPISRRL